MKHPPVDGSVGAAVEIHDLVVRYGDVTAVDGLTLSVGTGTVTSVLGPNGAGKTSTVETCEGFRRATSGTVRVLGLDPVRDAAALRPRVGVMLQAGGAWSGVRAHEMLRHVASLHAHPLDVDALVERLGLGSCGRTAYRRLSGGQQQRLGLAMAVVGRPELVFLDEPTAGLDPQARRATWDLLDELRANGVTVVLTTHFMDEAETLSDIVHIVDAGRVIASGSPAHLVRSGAENTVRFAARPGLDVDALMTALPADTKVRETAAGQYVVIGTVDPGLLATLTAWFAGQGVLAESVLVEKQTLEDRFLDLTGRALR
ncbi:ABC-2 type transport system ATP-binding protein [Aeromicrobium sp. SORGH_AS981]|uniref:ABC transporter ATP-binding protein n=1 Tax=Aeromicrobium sp. SORGH_AS_0981 TaxID=3041802 RepID=UPI00285A7330|nr:ABC transporter ATP-binding protein [Aeromicrobium sp. SORGH_AS_0981]MDR6119426.1 ABC-2 type transport system ATP-binding protein [Aeromicrobium sp. SORGH_AS_0981]